jgi:hypothetical protein
VDEDFLTGIVVQELEKGGDLIVGRTEKCAGGYADVGHAGILDSFLLCVIFAGVTKVDNGRERAGVPRIHCVSVSVEQKKPGRTQQAANVSKTKTGEWKSSFIFSRDVILLRRMREAQPRGF